MIVNQPHDEQLGIQLIKALESNQFNQLTIMVAYAKLSGVYRVSPYLEKFRNNGGTIRCVVGIDQQNTTYDALSQLLNLANEIYIFHSESVSQTFHIKCYWLSGENNCWYAIGSNNLTAGGLFSNYELSMSTSLSGEEAHEENETLSGIYSTYTDADSVCSRKLDDAFLEELISGGYVVKEIQQRKALAESARQARSIVRKTKLFGNEVFPAPALPEQFRKSKAAKPDAKKSPTPKKPNPPGPGGPVSRAAASRRNGGTAQVESTKVSKEDNTYLIRLVPRAGDRSKQVHFTVDLLEKYFCLKPGDGILVQEMLASGAVGEIEHRQVVFSQRNRNVKIELAGASMLDTNYPANPEIRPVLILKKVNANLFVYMILLAGNEGYDAINTRLKSLPAGRSLPYEVIDESTMFSLWDNCPIV